MTDMTTPIGTPIQYFSTPADGYGGNVLPGTLAAPGPDGSDDGAMAIVFGTDGKMFVRAGLLTRATFLEVNGVHGASWGPVA
jgi:hypothetical protein